MYNANYVHIHVIEPLLLTNRGAGARTDGLRDIYNRRIMAGITKLSPGGPRVLGYLHHSENLGAELHNFDNLVIANTN